MQGRERERRALALAIRNHSDISWRRHESLRFATVLGVPVGVYVLVPGGWWFIALAFGVAGILLEVSMRRWRERIYRLGARLPAAVLVEARQVIVLSSSAATVIYTAPYLFLAFAPFPGPALGMMFCAGASMVATGQHVLTRNMVFFSLPFVTVAWAANAYFMAGGWLGFGLGVFALLGALNAIILGRAGALSFQGMIDARLDAEDAAQNLDQRLKERTAELEIQTVRAEQASRAKSQFLATMTHELRTPLNAVIGYAEIAREELEDGDASGSPEHLEKIRNAGAHLLSLINDILDLSRIESGQVSVRGEMIDVRGFAQRALDLAKPLAAKNNSTCDIVVEPGVSAMRADPSRLSQCLANLLSNAAKFTKNGRIILHVRRDGLSDGRDGVAFTVTDTGIGMSEETVASLFQPFTQGDSTATRAFEGTGLGLAITRRLAHLMGGEIAVQSQLGRGASFTLTLPLLPGGADEAEAQRSAA